MANRDSGWALTGSDVIAQFLKAQGVSTVFAYPGTSELALCDAVLATERIRLINSRGDKEAAFMAGGANRVRAGSCAAILHGARGITNALGAVADLRRSEAASLCIIGMASTSSAKFLPPHAEPDLLSIAGGYARSSHDCSDLTDLDPLLFVRRVAAAFQAVARRPGGPVLLGVPADMLSGAFVPPSLVEDALSQPEADRMCADEIPAAVELLRGARHPVIMVDDYAFVNAPGIEEYIDELSFNIGAPVLQVAYRRGPMLFQQLRRQSVRNLVGLFDQGNPAHAHLIHSADVLVTVEDRNMYPRVIGHLGSGRKIALTTNPIATTKNGYIGDGDLVLSGAPLDILPALIQGAGQRRVSIRAPEVPERRTSESGRNLVRSLGKGLSTNAGAVLVDDSQMFGGLIASNYDLVPSGITVLGSHGGFVGGGLATAVGIAVANPDVSVVCTLGDQGLTNAVQALAVAAEQRTNLLVIVCNNGSSVSLRKQSGADGLVLEASAFLSNPPAMDYCAIARGFGLQTNRVAWSDERHEDHDQAADRIHGAVSDALRTGGPHLLELVVPNDPSFWSGVWSVRGLDENAAPVDSGPSVISPDRVLVVSGSALAPRPVSA